MHLSLEQFNLLRSRNLSGNDRTHFVEHILDCDTCAGRFRLLNRLDSELRTPAAERGSTRRIRYFLGVAAVLAMGAYPYLFRGHSDRFPTTVNRPVEMASAQELNGDQLSLLSQVKRVNFRHALDQWGNRNNLTQIIALQNSGL